MTSAIAPVPAPRSDRVRIRQVKIEKFRVIGAAEIELGDTVALVGQNGAGKSSVLHALNAFFNFEYERADFEARRHSCSSKEQRVIEATIEGLESDAECAQILADRSPLRAQLKFRKQAKWNVFVDGKWQSAAPGPYDAVRRQISYELIPTRRDRTVAHDPSTGLVETAADEWVTPNRLRRRVSQQVVTRVNRLHKR